MPSGPPGNSTRAFHRSGPDTPASSARAIARRLRGTFGFLPSAVDLTPTSMAPLTTTPWFRPNILACAVFHPKTWNSWRLSHRATHGVPWFDLLTNMEAVVDGPNFNCFPSSFSPSAVRGTISDYRFERCSSRRPLPAIGGAQPTVRWCPANKRAKATKESIGFLV